MGPEHRFFLRLRDDALRPKTRRRRDDFPYLCEADPSETCAKPLWGGDTEAR